MRPPRTSLVGGDAAADRVAGLLAASRVVTLTGPGGVGKTRLAVECGTRALHDHPGGVWMVDLGAHEPAATDEGRLAEQVANVLGVRDDPTGGDARDGTGDGVVERIARVVGDQPTLLVLDNCERVRAEAAQLVDRLLGSAAGLHVLATSRLPLEVSGEQLCPVTPLAVPEGDPAAPDPRELVAFDAVRLFAARAAAAVPDFAVTADNAAAVATICRRLDGLPLALELAAARLRALSVGDLAARLDDQPGLLAGGPRSAPERQQTLRALVDWSWDLLTGREQTVLARLSVFRGAASLPAVEAVAAGDGVEAADVLDLVARLVDHSLLVAETGSDTRYRMLETIRSATLERLEASGEHAAARRRHAEFYAELAETADAHVRGHDQQRWLERLDAEAANLRAAADWAACADAGLALRLANALAWYRYLRGRPGQACRELARALHDDVDPAARAKALAWLGSLGALDRSVEDPAGHGRAALDLYAGLDRDSDHAHAKLLLSGLLIQRREPHTDRLVGEALETFQSSGDEWGTAGALTVRGWRALESGDPGAARRDAEAAHARYQRLADRWGQIRAAELLAQVAELHGDYDRAAGLHHAMLQQAQALELWSSVALELGRLGRVALLTGDDQRAAALHEQAWELACELAFEQGTAFARVGLGLILRRRGRLAAAEEHFRAVLDWHEGRGFDSGVAFCLAQLGFVAELRGEAEGARALHRDALEAARRSGDRRAVALALEGLAGAAAADADPAEAARLLGAASGIRAAAGAHLPPPERHDVDRIASAAAAALGDDVYARLFEQGSSTPTEMAARR